MDGAVASPVAAPPFELEDLTIEIPIAAAPEAAFCALPRDQFVDQARAISLIPPRATFAGDEPVTVNVTLSGHALRATADGWIGDKDGFVPLADALIAWWPVLGWDVFTELRDELTRAAGRTGADQHAVRATCSLLALVDACERALVARIAEFLLTFEANMLAMLESTLERAPDAAEQSRARYLEPLATPATGPTELEDLHEHVKALGAARANLVAFEAQYAGVILAGQLAQQIALPCKLRTLVPLPPGGRLGLEAFGALGAVLEQWWEQEIHDYNTGRDLLLRAAAVLYAQARERHPVLPHVWSPTEAVPTPDGLARRIDAVCDEVVAASRKALEAVRNGEGYRLLHQHVTIYETVGASAIMHPAGAAFIPIKERRSGSVADLMRLREGERPEAALGALLAERATVTTRAVNPLAGAVNGVTVWDFDALRATTIQAMGGRLDPVERATLDAVDWEAFKQGLVAVAEDFALRRALDLALGPTGLGVVIDALLGIVDLVHDYASYSAEELLAKSELLADSPAARRILSRDPSLVPVFLDVVGSLGDAFAISRLPRIAKHLRQLQVSVFLASAGPEFAKLVAQVVMALMQREDEEKRRRDREQGGR